MCDCALVHTSSNEIVPGVTSSSGSPQRGGEGKWGCFRAALRAATKKRPPQSVKGVLPNEAERGGILRWRGSRMGLWNVQCDANSSAIVTIPCREHQCAPILLLYEWKRPQAQNSIHITKTIPEWYWMWSSLILIQFWLTSKSPQILAYPMSFYQTNGKHFQNSELEQNVISKVEVIDHSY